MYRDHRLYLDDILEAIHRIHSYVQDMSEDQFSVDLKTQDSVIRNLEVIGEAAKNLPKEIICEAKGVEWRKIAGLRNILAHEYFGVSLPIIWDIVQNKLDPLEKACQFLIGLPDKSQS